MTGSFGRRTVSPIALTAAVLILGLHAGFRTARTQSLPNKEHTPFLAEMRILHAPGPRHAPFVQTAQYARRGDGSHVTLHEVAAPDGETGTSVGIHDMRNNRSISLYGSIKASMTFYHSAEEMRRWLAGGQQTCASPETAAALRNPTATGTASMHGRKARRVFVIEPRIGKRGGERIETWVAEDLDCFVLQKTIASPSGALQITAVTKLTEGEPPDWMFEIPPDYIEMSPVEAEAAYQAKYPGHSLLGRMTDLMQQRYEAARPNN